MAIVDVIIYTLWTFKWNNKKYPILFYIDILFYSKKKDYMLWKKKSYLFYLSSLLINQYGSDRFVVFNATFNNISVMSFNQYDSEQNSGMFLSTLFLIFAWNSNKISNHEYMWFTSGRDKICSSKKNTYKGE